MEEGEEDGAGFELAVGLHTWDADTARALYATLAAYDMPQAGPGGGDAVAEGAAELTVIWPSVSGGLEDDAACQPASHQSHNEASFKCKCQPIGVDEQRARYIGSGALKRSKPSFDMAANQFQCHTWTHSPVDVAAASIEPTQSAIFEPSRLRNSLARKFARGELAEQVLYALEELLAEAQGCLVRCLAGYTSLARSHLGRLLLCDDNQPLEDFCIPYSHHEPMIREPVPWRGQVRALNTRKPTVCTTRMDSGDSGCEPGSDKGSTELLLEDDHEERESIHLSQLVAFQASSSIQALVKSSCQFFQGLIDKNALFRWLEEPQASLLSQRQLQLMACVEFQKLRSVLRYQWLADCLLHLSAVRQQMMPAGSLDSMGSTLLRHLLRDEFLKRALERLCGLLESHQSKLSRGAESQTRCSWKLQVPLRLIQAPDNPSLAAASRPEQEVKETLDAVLQELVAACSSLPKLDLEQPLSSHCDEQSERLPVLHGGDDKLLEHFRTRIHHLVDSGFSLGAPVSWLAEEHHCCLELLNKIRQAPAPTNLSGCHLTALERIGQLEAARGQLRELETQAGVLQCKFELKSRDLGLVLLDCGPLNQCLLESVRKEQLIVERMVVDDSLKLLHLLRLHFEEIQLGVDLDTVVEDYLSERRRALAAASQPSGAGTTGAHHLQVFDEESSGEVVSNVDAEEPGAEGDGWDEELLMRLEGGSSTVHMQLAALTGSEAGAAEQGATSPNVKLAPTETTMTTDATDLSPPLAQRSSPIPAAIECRLLVECYQFLDELLGGQLTSLRQDLMVFFESLIFMGEQAPALWAELLEAGDSLSDQWALAGELVQSARQLGNQLTRAEDKLTRAHRRLTESNVIRSLTLSRLVIEFRLLINGIGQRRLPGTAEAQASLDSVQEAANWTRQLEIRARYLSFQNQCIAREVYLLSGRAGLSRRQPSFAQGINITAISEVCGQSLRRWGQLAKLLAGLWTLAERLETQQVKWLNSDLRQLDYRQLVGVLESLKSTLAHLEKAALSDYHWHEAPPEEHSHKQVFESNLTVLQWRLNQFELTRLPLFRYLSGKHLTEPSQWAELARLADQNHPRLGAIHTCTTLAQLLEYGLAKHVDQIEAMAEHERVEREIERFLELEFPRPGKGQRKSRHLPGQAPYWFEGWSEPELELVARKYLERKMSSSCDIQLSSECQSLARALVTYHGTAERFLRASLHLNLISPSSSSTSTTTTHQLLNKKGRPFMIVLPFTRLSSATFINSGLFVELLRLAADRWLLGRERLERRAEKVSRTVASVGEHLKDLEELISRAQELKDNELAEVSRECERSMCKLECQSAQLELEREILATKEALALGQQRQALGTRDECVRQVTERAIPSLRAAAGALDSLDGRSLRFLCALKPAPPEPVRVVLEAVCLLRCHIVGEEARMQPERHFDALAGRMLEDYWPPTSRLLNGTHSSRLVADLRLVGKRPMSNQLMRFIRRHYLSSSGFRAACSSQVSWPREVSRECALLAKWLLAVDVFCRVINVVRPRYKEYLEAERKLSALLAEVNNRRRQIELVAGELRGLEDSLERQKALRTLLADSLDQCRRQLSRAEGTRWELLRKRSACVAKLERIRASQRRLVNRCALRATLCLYVVALREPSDSCRLLRLFQQPQYNTPEPSS